jgi:hypothetical protein
MKQATHTPVPWETENLFVRAPSGEYIADVLSGPDAPGFETATDNAALIAAAPDLLAALEVVEQFAQAGDMPGGFEHVLGFVRAALDKVASKNNS